MRTGRKEGNREEANQHPKSPVEKQSLVRLRYSQAWRARGDKCIDLCLQMHGYLLTHRVHKLICLHTGSTSAAKIKEENEDSVYRDRHQNRPSKISVIPCRHVPMFSRPDPSL